MHKTTLSLLLACLFGLFASAQDQQISLFLNSGQIVFNSPTDPTQFNNDNALRFTLSVVPVGVNFSVKFSGAGFEQEINQGNYKTLGIAGANGAYRFKLPMGKGLSGEESPNFGFPLTLSVTKGGSPLSLQTSAGAELANPLSLGGPSAAGMMPSQDNGEREPIRPLEDALELTIAIKEGDISSVENILGKYSRQNRSDLEGLQQEFEQQNQLIYQQIDHLSRLNESDAGRGFAVGSDIRAQGGESISGILSPTTFADALGTFIADRFKQELNIAYLAKFREQLQQQEELQILFPKTTTLMLNTEPWEYTTFMQSMREAFRTDLEDLVPNTSNLIESPQFQSHIKDTLEHDVFQLFNFGLNAYQSAKNGTSPGAILRELDPQDFEEPSLRAAFTVLSAFNEALQSENNPNAWVGKKSVTSLSSNKDAQKIFLGLVLYMVSRELNEIKIKVNGEEQQFYDFLNSKATQADSVVKELQLFVRSLLRNVEQIQASMEGLSNLKGEKFNYDLFREYIGGILDIINSSVNIVEIIDPDADLSKVDKGISIATDIFDIGNAVDEQRYGVAISELVDLLKKILPQSPALDKIMQYGTFMVTIVSAETSEELQAALESAALPVGSYRIKRQNYGNIAVQSYAGLFGGYEMLRNNQVADDRKGAGTVGFTAPIGISFSRGLRKTFSGTVDPKFRQNLSYVDDNGDTVVLRGSSISLFVSVIDLGAVVSFRIQNDSTPLPELTWKNFLAPGGFIVYGFRNSPLSLGIGGQYGPQLRSISATDSTGATAQITSSAWRVNAFLAVDIPLFNFHTRNTQPSFDKPDWWKTETSVRTVHNSPIETRPDFESLRTRATDANAQLPKSHQVPMEGVSDWDTLNKAVHGMYLNLNSLNKKKEKFKKLGKELEALKSEIRAGMRN